jgi:tRNA uridine 5-carboxymethylaminomethyl modification enzyme
MYLNGLSMSLPVDVQERVVRALPGCRNAVFLRPAYAVEYDVVHPEQLDDTLEVRALRGLFLAGQINGTSGYEEAAGQGLVAGVNAAFAVAPGTREGFVLRRDEAYIGVMIDDLVTLGTEEPYRLMTSRAEHRLLLGPDSAYRRLLPRAVAAGLVPPSVAEPLLEREERLLAKPARTLEETRVSPSPRCGRRRRRGVELNRQVTLAGLLRGPKSSWTQSTACSASSGSPKRSRVSNPRTRRGSWTKCATTGSSARRKTS